MADLPKRLQAALAGRYRIERELGRGGMATVFLAEDLRHPRRVAVKVLDPDAASAIGPERFVREIATAARLAHPHILPLHDSGEADGLLYYVMPHVSGGSLRHRLAHEGPLSPVEVLRLAREMADALDHAHRAGVVHRDIKPENVLLEAGHAVIADFGLACAWEPSAAGRLTTVGVTLGTPAYMSPEQATGIGELDGRSDQYSLACTIYELLTGEPPFTGPSAQGVIRRHVTEVPRPVTALRPGVPAAMRDALARALAKEPSERYASTTAFAAALAGESGPAPIEDAEFAPTTETPVAPRPAGATPTPTPAPTPSTARRPKWPAVGIAFGAVALVVALAALAGWLGWLPFGEQPREPAAGRAWTLVAEFESAPEDSLVAMAARDLLSAAIDQSKIVASVPADQVRQALRLAGRPPGTRVDATLAHELAVRGSVRTVLEGRLGRLGSAYTLVVRVVDADSARVVLTETATAKDAGGLVAAVESLARKLRRGLGENRRSLASTEPVMQWATPSFEAFQLASQAARGHRVQFANRRALTLYQAAVGLDPGFAGAWRGMAVMYHNLGYADSARACVEQALRHPDRLSAGSRLGLERLAAMIDGDLERIQLIDERTLADRPGDLGALTSRAGWLVGQGRFEESVALYRQVIRRSPFGPNELVWNMLAGALTALGRFDEAREVLSHARGVFKAANLADVEMSANRWAVADSIMSAHLDDARLNAEVPGAPFLVMARVQFGRGALRRSAEYRARAVATALGASDGVGALYWARIGTEHASVAGGAYPLPPEPLPRDTSAMSVVARGLWGTVARDLELARRCANDAGARPARQLADQGVAPLLLRARVATLEGRPREAVELLRASAVARMEPGLPNNGTGLNWVRWSIADAFEQLGQPDSAAAYLERTVQVPVLSEVRPFCHHRLVLLYARMGRIGDARRHLAGLEQAWDRPDPEVRAMMKAARDAVREAARGAPAVR